MPILVEGKVLRARHLSVKSVQDLVEVEARLDQGVLRVPVEKVAYAAQLELSGGVLLEFGRGKDAGCRSGDQEEDDRGFNPHDIYTYLIA